MDIKEQIAVMQGFADGKEIEFRAPNEINDRWEKVETPLWDWHNFEYRIKPEPPIKAIRWGIYLIKQQRLHHEIFADATIAKQQCKDWNVITRCNAYRVVKLQLTEIQEDATQS